MDSLLFLVAFVSLYKLEVIKPIKNIYSDYSAKENCDGLKGLLALVVVLAHLRVYTKGGILLNIANYAYVVVAVFLFISGFGTFKQYIIKKNYLNQFIPRKVISLLVPYLIVVVIYWGTSPLTIGRWYSIGEVFASFINGEPIATNSWYIILTIVLMAVFYFFSKCLKEHYLAIVALTFIFCLLLIPGLKALGYGPWWYFSNFGFPLGMAWALYEKKIVDVVKHFYYWVIAILLLGICFYVIIAFHDKIDLEDIIQINIYTSILSPLIVFLICMKVKFGSPILKFYGSISFELYMIHGLFIDVLSERISNDFLWSIIAVVCSTVTAVLLHKLNKAIGKKLNSQIGKKL